ncbi:MAG: hypothetical protein LBL35_00340 [Clostridiales bacterium]|jgi:hypothetical protein|nr:hypothetical protein [Clostridiales bacterium]
MIIYESRSKRLDEPNVNEFKRVLKDFFTYDGMYGLISLAFFNVRVLTDEVTDFSDGFT